MPFMYQCALYSQREKNGQFPLCVSFVQFTGAYLQGLFQGTFLAMEGKNHTW